ncbi:Ras-related protein RABF1 [Tritrichomonas foetus]|uniref:Ras-related protein RABF1 n=1 Tax=Tritrichomonas foetus TaxID=1144522 RepID=A0A1J4KKU9_9EUKA|nr:Ras-related protein RABF1 [Tritrichomonas foetus]|eukprot:OHT10420.1 Ras-related protein RABF1 [Tritrichomonas foetus]
MLTDRVTICGDSGVGKTYIFRLLKGIGLPEFSRSTRIASHFPMKCQLTPETTFNINIWDTGGDTKMRDLAEIYLINIDVAIIVFDLSNAQTVENLNGWIETVKNKSPEAEILIVGNKKDAKSVSDDLISEATNGHFYIETAASLASDPDSEDPAAELKDKLVETCKTIKIKQMKPKSTPNSPKKGKKKERKRQTCNIS